MSHNATGTPSFFGLFGAYEWKLQGDASNPPSMVVRLPREG
ncbi:hypothetical protein [Tepidimonas taiwanensis]|nr:hypothetical protein [Tepidimonas taiwanensis]